MERIPWAWRRAIGTLAPGKVADLVILDGTARRSDELEQIIA